MTSLWRHLRGLNRIRSAITLLGALFVLGSTVALWAQESTRGGVILHEYFDGSLPGSRAGEGTPAPSGELGGPPALTLEPRPSELIFTGDGPMGDGPIEAPHGPLDPRGGESRLDEETDRVDELDYFENFEPSIIPYKRMISQNRVQRAAHGGYAVVLDSRRERLVSVDVRPQRPDEDLFWGSFLVRVDREQRHAIPSVAAEQRILQVDTEPAVPLEIHRDEGDNYYVTADYDGLLRINMRIAVERYYFDGDLSSRVGWRDFPGQLLPGLDAQTRQVAQGVLAEIGAGRSQPPRQALDRLIEHYRDFEGKPLPAAARQGELYANISREKVGVCRHRSLAFVVSAQALGIPTRYISNEAHAFVEVYWPGQGWRRVDLGGAAEEVNRRDGGQGRVHDGAANDPLPQPPAYRSELERLMGGEGAPEGAGSPSADRAEASPGEASPVDGIPDGASTVAGPSREGAEGVAGVGEEIVMSAEPIEAGATDEDPADERRPTRVRILGAANEVMRGEAITVYGDLRTSSGAPLGGREVRLFLGPSGQENESASRLLGRGPTDGSGRFEFTVRIEGDVSIGRWTLRAVFDGDEEYQGTNSSP